MSPENQKQFKDNLLLSVNNEKNDILRRRMCDVASEVARNQLDDDGNNSWPEFLNFLFQCANSPSNDLKDSALRMFTLVFTILYLNFFKFQFLTMFKWILGVCQAFLVINNLTIWW